MQQKPRHRKSTFTDRILTPGTLRHFANTAYHSARPALVEDPLQIFLNGVAQVSRNVSKSDMVTGLAIILMAAAAFAFRKRNGNTGKLPPGPRGIPFLGYLPFLRSNHHAMFKNLAKIYGPIVR